MSKKNSEGYMDITANEALDAVEREEREVRKLIQTIQNICSLSGYKILTTPLYSNLQADTLCKNYMKISGRKY